MTESVPTTSAPPGSAVTHLDALPPGTRLGEFELRGLLGVGGFGMVYQAYDHSLQRDVAIKEYLPASLARRSAGTAVSIRSSVDAQTFEDGLKSFMAEARLLAQFDHPSLVKVFRFWEENSTAYMVMPLYRGITLRQARQQMRTPPPEEWLRKVLWSVLGALKVLHNGDTMHRDISPENIFLQDIGPPVLLDLGAARRAIGEKNQQLTATLKFSYAPIEQYGDDAALRQGPWTDLYSLAAVMHGLLTNELPLPATLRAVRDRLPSFANVAKKVQAECGLTYSTEFVLTMDQALSIRPHGRPKSVSTFARLMELRVPSGMGKFDWRADLGPIYLAPNTTLDGRDTSLDQTVMLADVADVPGSAKPARAPGKPLFSGGRPAAARIGLTHGQWAGVGGVLAALVVAILWMGHAARPGGGTAATTEPMVATAAAPTADSAASGAARDTTALLSPTSAPPSAQPAAAASTAQILDTAGGGLATRVEKGKATTLKKPLPVVEPARNTSTVVTTSTNTSPASVSPRTAGETSSSPVVKAPPPVQSTPESICADRNFLVRPMCVFQECQKPEFVNTGFCQENARRLRESRNPNN